MSELPYVVQCQCQKCKLMEIDRLHYVPLDYGTLCLFQYVAVHLLTFLKKVFKTYLFKMFISECL